MNYDSTERSNLESGIRSCVRRIGRRVVVDANRFDAVIEGGEPDPQARPTYLTVRQLAERHPAFTEAALRQLIARAEKSVAGGAHHD